MKKKDIADSGAQYAGTQPIQHAEIVLSQPEPEKKEKKPTPGPTDQTDISPVNAENSRIRKTRPKPIL